MRVGDVCEFNPACRFWLEPWVEKAWYEMRQSCLSVTMLLPANRAEQGFWQRHIEPYRDGRRPADPVQLATSFLPGRLRFARPNQTTPKNGDHPPFGCVVITWSRGET